MNIFIRDTWLRDHSFMIQCFVIRMKQESTCTSLLFFCIFVIRLLRKLRLSIIWGLFFHHNRNTLSQKKTHNIEVAKSIIKISRKIVLQQCSHKKQQYIEEVIQGIYYASGLIWTRLASLDDTSKFKDKYLSYYKWILPWQSKKHWVNQPN